MKAFKKATITAVVKFKCKNMRLYMKNLINRKPVDGRGKWMYEDINKTSMLFVASNSEFSA